MSSILPDSSTEAGRLSQQIFYFATLMSNGDLVVASDGPRILDVAKVVGDYRFEAGSDFPHRRRVEWFNLPEWGIPHVDHLDAIIEELGKYPRDLVEIERRILLGPFDTDDNEDTDTPPGIKSVPPLAGWPARIQTALERKSQVILYGPPGTGKTYWAEITARELAARSSFGLEFSQLADEQRSFVVGDGVDFRGLVRMCCFHPAYGYEDFIEGYKPEKASDQMVFNRRDGVFKKLCDDAQAKPDHHFYLIIDEINRGDIPRIFGELLTVLEKNKRGRSIILPLTGAPFQVPPNVYIIATMNTADRSIALLDTALRRRFGFIELMPDFSVFGDAVVEGIPLGPWLEALNKRICTFIGRNARNLQIGHSYLLQGGQPLSDFARFRDVVREDIITLLEEYCYEDYQTMEKILGKGLVDSAKQQINSELFEPHKQDDLIQELLAFCPEVETSHQAVTSNSDTAAEGAEDSADLAAPAS